MQHHAMDAACDSDKYMVVDNGQGSKERKPHFWLAWVDVVGYHAPRDHATALHQKDLGESLVRDA
jgi:hypothetical protein